MYIWICALYKHCILYTPSAVMFIAVYDVEVAYPKIFTSDESPHTIIIHFIKNTEHCMQR